MARSPIHGSFVRSKSFGAAWSPIDRPSRSASTRCVAYAAFLAEDYAPVVVAARLRQFAGRVTKGLRSGAVLRAAINEARTKDAILDLLCRYAEAAAEEAGEPRATALGDAEEVA